jgi:hypothetical protein
MPESKLGFQKTHYFLLILQFKLSLTFEIKRKVRKVSRAIGMAPKHHHLCAIMFF